MGEYWRAMRADAIPKLRVRNGNVVRPSLSAARDRMASGTSKKRRSRATDTTVSPQPKRVGRSDDSLDAFRCIRALFATLETSARAVEERSGLTNAQLFLLRQIAGAKGLTVNDLAARTGAAQSSVSVVVARLVRAGNVRRGPVPGDGRRVMLTATPRGRSALRRAPAPATERLLDALGMLSRADTRSISRGLSALLAAMEESVERAPLLFEN
jgi:DNA-binding MarR family transcriptional regulator